MGFRKLEYDGELETKITVTYKDIVSITVQDGEEVMAGLELDENETLALITMLNLVSQGFTQAE